MASTRPDLAAIDAALAKGAWWARLFRDLADQGVRRAEALTLEARKGLWHFVDDVDRITRAVRLTAVAAIRLGGFLSGLADLRKLSPDDLATARARAKAKAEAETAARETAREKARALRAVRAAEVREHVVDLIEREKPARRDRDPLVEALEKRLAVDPALIDLDDLPLRETVMRICADLGITPDWSRWEAGDWMTSDSPAPPPEPTTQPTATLWKPAPPPKRHLPPVLQGLSDLFARRPDTAISLVLQAGPFARPWLPPRPG